MPRTDFEKLLEKLEYSHSRSAFRDFCELSSITFANAFGNGGVLPKDKAWEEREERYMRTIKGYSKEEAEVFPQMLNCLVDELDYSEKVGEGEGPHDFLGHFYMGALEGTRSRKWDSDLCFTPWNVCLMMAQMTLDQPCVSGLIKEKGYFRMQEPACGAGIMVIAAANVLHKNKFNFQEVMHVEAWDVRDVCFYMTYLQFTLLHIPAIVIRGNTLSREIWDCWPTPAHTLGMWDYRLRRDQERQEFADAESKKEVYARLISVVKQWAERPFELNAEVQKRELSATSRVIGAVNTGGSGSVRIRQNPGPAVVGSNDRRLSDDMQGSLFG